MRRLSLALILVFAGIGLGEEIPPQEGTYYTYGQSGISKTELNGDRLDLVFKPVDEQFYWCPGIKVQQTKLAVVVTFVRCKTSVTCGVDTKASIGKRLIRKLSINTKGLDVYVRNGPKKFKRIYRSPNSKVEAHIKKRRQAEKKAQHSDQIEKSSNVKAHTTRTGQPALLRPISNHGSKRHIRNDSFQSSVD